MANTSGPRLSRTVLEICHVMAHDLFGRYHPELHYMRGPGPKCREKLMIKAEGSQRGAANVADAIHDALAKRA